MVKQVSDYLSGRYSLIIIVILCFASRIPQLCSPNLILDGDECVVALMAKHLYQGKDFSIFFWGQNYGFSAVETAMLVPFYALLGISTVSVKMGMLSLWTIGIIFFYKSLLTINEKGNLLPLLLTLLLVSAPAWADWSMKARGGYLTSFTFSSISMYLLFNEFFYRKKATYAVLALTINLIYLSQPFWLAGILPLVFYRLVNEKSWAKLLLFILALAVQILAFHLYKQNIQNTFEPPLFIPDGEILGQQLTRLPKYLYSSLHGWHYFSNVHAPNTVSAIWAVALFVITCLLAAAGLFHLISGRRSFLFICSIIFIPLCLALTFFSYSMEVRYLLPVSGFAIFSMQIALRRVRNTRWINGGLIMLILVGLIAVATFHDFRYLKTTRQGLLQTITYLHQNGTQYVYSANDMLSWQVLFYSEEKIISRGFPKPGRHGGFNSAVDRAYHSGKKTALIGFRGEFYNQPEDAYNLEMNGLFVRHSPAKEDLAKDFHF